jgi:hypothetical protein
MEMELDLDAWLGAVVVTFPSMTRTTLIGVTQFDVESAPISQEAKSALLTGVQYP